MSTLRQEALQIVNDVPEEFLGTLVNNLRKFKRKYVDSVDYANIRAKAATPISEEEFQKFLSSAGGINPKKAAAFAALEEWRERNREILSADIDWDRVREEAINEKYGLAN